VSGQAAAALQPSDRACTLGEVLIDAEPAGRTDAEAWIELYHLGAFARGRPDSAATRAIRRGASAVEPGDVLLSRATFEPRRAWVVGEPRSRRAVATHEWLVLRSLSHEPAYLRHIVVSNEFQVRFMRAAGRARYASTRSRKLAAVVLPCPPRPVQRAIAALLDEADALRRERRRALEAVARLDELLAQRTYSSGGSAVAAGSPVGAQSEIASVRALMQRSAERFDALLAVLRDRAYRGELTIGGEPHHSGG
jgi:hypothetical protein